MSDSVGAIGNINSSLPPTTTTEPLYDGTAEVASRAGFMSLFILFSFIGNIVLVATIVQSRSLRKVKLNRMITSLSFVNMLNCVCNMPLVLGFTITSQWDYGDVMCRINSCLMHLLSIAMIMGIAVMTIDRTIAVINPSKYESIMSDWKCNVLIVCTWLQAVAFSVPLLSMTLPSEPFASRYLCSIKAGTTIVYPIITSVICFLIPSIAILVSFAVITKYVIHEKEMHHQLSRDHRYTDALINETREWKEIKRTRFVFSLFVLWSLLEGPYHLYTHIEQCHSSSEIQGTSDTSGSLFSTNSQTIHILEVSFTWMKFSYAMILPFATFFWRKTIWQKFKDLILCRKSNLIVDGGEANKTENNNKDNRKEAFTERNSVFKFPVLFATSRGIHVKKYDQKDKEESELSETQTSEYFYADMTTKSNDITIMKNKIKKCDVNGPNSVHNVDGDTSDYESPAEEEQQDPFSVSDSSVFKAKKNSVDVERNLHTRSKSETADSSVISTARTPRGVKAELEETQTPRKKERKRNSSQPDSGMESNFNSTEKRRKKKRNSADNINEGDHVNGQSVEHEHRADSNDSGRGSVSNKEKKKKKKRKASTVDAANDDEIPSNQSSPRDHQIANQNAAIDKPRNSKSSLDGEVVESAKVEGNNDDVGESKLINKPVKTKKKKNKPRTESVADNPTNAIEIRNPVFQDDEVDSNVTRRPPARLEPLNHTSAKSHKTSPVPPLRNAQKVDPVSGDIGSQAQAAKRRARNRTNSGPKESETKETASQAQSEESAKPERRRRSTADSQTPLINSGSSVDLHEMKAIANSGNNSNKTRRKKRNKSEVSPDSATDFDSTQSPR